MCRPFVFINGIFDMVGFPVFVMWSLFLFMFLLLFLDLVFFYYSIFPPLVLACWLYLLNVKKKSILNVVDVVELRSNVLLFIFYLSHLKKIPLDIFCLFLG